MILEDQDEEGIDLATLEKDLTKKLRFPKWQLGAYSNIDSFQAHGYSVMETIYDKTSPGHVSREHLQFEDFAFVSDTKDLQALEMSSRRYYFTRTKLLELVGDSEDDFVGEQVNTIVETDPVTDKYSDDVSTKDASLYRIYKNMFRVGGVVMVAWSCPTLCSSWIRVPRPLFIGRKNVQPSGNVIAAIKSELTGVPESTNAQESEYPYFLYPYTVSEDTTISNMKGRGFLDQDIQAVSYTHLTLPTNREV